MLGAFFWGGPEPGKKTTTTKYRILGWGFEKAETNNRVPIGKRVGVTNNWQPRKAACEIECVIKNPRDVQAYGILTPSIHKRCHTLHRVRHAWAFCGMAWLGRYGGLPRAGGAELPLPLLPFDQAATYGAGTCKGAGSYCTLPFCDTGRGEASYMLAPYAIRIAGGKGGPAFKVELVKDGLLRPGQILMDRDYKVQMVMRP